MFQKLQNKWKVSAARLLLIIATFAIGGSLCGYLGRKLMAYTSLDKGVLWIVFYIILVTLLWPFCVLVISIPLGQFTFFKWYLIKIFLRTTGKKKITNTKEEENNN